MKFSFRSTLPRLLAIALIAGGLILHTPPQPAFAYTATANGCEASSSSYSWSFPTLNAPTGSTTLAIPVTVFCGTWTCNYAKGGDPCVPFTDGTPVGKALTYNVGVASGSHGDGSNRRVYSSSRGYLTYGVYADAGFSTPCPYSGASCYSHTTNTSGNDSMTLYLKVTAGQPYSPGTYSDNVTGNLGPVTSPYLLTMPMTLSFTQNAACSMVVPTSSIAQFATPTSLNLSEQDLSGIGIQSYCTLNTTYWLTMNAGQNSSNPNYRYMKRSGGSELLLYYLYQQTGGAIWGDGSYGTTYPTGTTTSYPYVINVNPVLPAQTATAAGNYSDTVTITTSY